MKFLTGIACLLAFFTSPLPTCYADIITGFTTSPAWLANQTESHGLVDVVSGGTKYDIVGSVSSVSGSAAYTWGENGTDPGSFSNAFTDNLLDTGSFNTASTSIFTFGAPVHAGNTVVVFWNVFATATPSGLVAVDSLGNQVGSTIALSSTNVSEGDFRWSSSAGVVTDRPIAGFTAGVTEFGGAISDIVGVRFDGPAGMDIQYVGIAVPEPSTTLLLSLSLVGVLLRRKRHCEI